MEVIDLFKKKKEAEQEILQEEEPSFEDVIKQNEANKKRLERERKKDNKSVIRSYRLKVRT